MADTTSTAGESLKDKILSINFLIILGLSNALWASTVGISTYIAEFYGVSPDTVKGNLPNSIYYAFYLIFSIPCFFYKKHLRAFFIAYLFTIAGILVRIKFFLPAASDEAATASTAETFYNGIKGMNGQIAANALIASAQPFVFGFTLMISTNHVTKKRFGVYIGLTSMTALLGYAIGYLVSIKKISSMDEYEDEYRVINYCYLAITLVLLATFLLAVFPYSYLSKLLCPRLHKEEDQLRATMAVVRTFATSPSFGETPRMELTPTPMSKSGKLQKEMEFATGSPSMVRAHRSHGDKTGPYDDSTCQQCTGLCQTAGPPVAIVFVYTLAVAVNYLIGNYLDNFLLDKGLDQDQAFIASMLYLLPGIMFPPVSGYLIDRTKKTWLIGLIIAVALLLSQILFCTIDALWMVYFSLTLNSISFACFGSTMLTLIGEMVSESQEKNYNNAMYSLSILGTLIMMLVPIPSSAYAGLYIGLNLITALAILLYLSINLQLCTRHGAPKYWSRP
jgi:MFS family permease